MEVALRALDKPMDESLDFLLELTAREQADVWLPVFAKGDLKLQRQSQAPRLCAEGHRPPPPPCLR